MKHIIIYTDGSAIPSQAFNVSGKKTKRYPIGWGGVLIHDDQISEFTEGQLVSKKYLHKFEHIAFVRAIKHAISLGYTPNQMTFYVDYSVIADSPSRIRPENHHPPEVLSKMKSLYRDINEFLKYEEEFIETIMECFKTSRIVKVKSHGSCVYNNRADYLAKLGRQRISPNRAQPVSFVDVERWIHGIADYFCDHVLEKPKQTLSREDGHPVRFGRIVIG